MLEWSKAGLFVLFFCLQIKNYKITLAVKSKIYNLHVNLLSNFLLTLIS
jgi:hypothetical protein